MLKHHLPGIVMISMLSFYLVSLWIKKFLQITKAKQDNWQQSNPLAVRRSRDRLRRSLSDSSPIAMWSKREIAKELIPKFLSVLSSVIFFTLRAQDTMNENLSSKPINMSVFFGSGVGCMLLHTFMENAMLLQFVDLLVGFRVMGPLKYCLKPIMRLLKGNSKNLRTSWMSVIRISIMMVDSFWLYFIKTLSFPLFCSYAKTPSYLPSNPHITCWDNAYHWFLVAFSAASLFGLFTWNLTMILRNCNWSSNPYWDQFEGWYLKNPQKQPASGSAPATGETEKVKVQMHPTQDGEEEVVFTLVDEGNCVEKWLDGDDLFVDFPVDLPSSFTEGLVRARWQQLRDAGLEIVTDGSECSRRLAAAEAAKSDGNKEVSRRKWSAARQHYLQGLQVLGFCPPEPCEKQARLETALQLNQALCEGHLLNFTLAAELCAQVLVLDARNVKARFRRATALGELQEYDSALEEIQMAVALDPGHSELLALRKRLNAKRLAIRHRQQAAEDAATCTTPQQAAEDAAEAETTGALVAALRLRLQRCYSGIASFINSRAGSTSECSFQVVPPKEKSEVQMVFQPSKNVQGQCPDMERPLVQHVFCMKTRNGEARGQEYLWIEHIPAKGQQSCTEGVLQRLAGDWERAATLNVQNKELPLASFSVTLIKVVGSLAWSAYVPPHTDDFWRILISCIFFGCAVGIAAITNYYRPSAFTVINHITVWGMLAAAITSFLSCVLASKSSKGAWWLPVENGIVAGLVIVFAISWLLLLMLSLLRGAPCKVDAVISFCGFCSFWDVEKGKDTQQEKLSIDDWHKGYHKMKDYCGHSAEPSQIVHHVQGPARIIEVLAEPEDGKKTKWVAFEEWAKDRANRSDVLARVIKSTTVSKDEPDKENKKGTYKEEVRIISEIHPWPSLDHILQVEQDSASSKKEAKWLDLNKPYQQLNDDTLRVLTIGICGAGKSTLLTALGGLSHMNDHFLVEEGPQSEGVTQKTSALYMESDRRLYIDMPGVQDGSKFDTREKVNATKEKLAKIIFMNHILLIVRATQQRFSSLREPFKLLMDHFGSALESMTVVFTDAAQFPRVEQQTTVKEAFQPEFKEVFGKNLDDVECIFIDTLAALPEYHWKYSPDSVSAAKHALRKIEMRIESSIEHKIQTKYWPPVVDQYEGAEFTYTAGESLESSGSQLLPQLAYDGNQSTDFGSVWKCKLQKLDKIEGSPEQEQGLTGQVVVGKRGQLSGTIEQPGYYRCLVDVERKIKLNGLKNISTSCVVDLKVGHSVTELTTVLKEKEQQFREADALVSHLEGQFTPDMNEAAVEIRKRRDDDVRKLDIDEIVKAVHKHRRETNEQINKVMKMMRVKDEEHQSQLEQQRTRLEAEYTEKALMLAAEHEQKMKAASEDHAKKEAQLEEQKRAALEKQAKEFEAELKELKAAAEKKEPKAATEEAARQTATKEAAAFSAEAAAEREAAERAAAENAAAEKAAAEKAAVEKAKEAPAEAEEGRWGATIEEWLMDTMEGTTVACYAGGLASQEDGNFYAACPVADEAGWALILKEDYKENILQEDGFTEKEMDIWEAKGLKHVVDTGRKPEWGLWMGGKKYIIIKRNSVEVGDNVVPTILAKMAESEWGGAVICKIKSQIVVGFWHEQKGTYPGYCNTATTAFASYLMDIGY